MKKILFIICGMLMMCGAYAAQIVNVEYIHNAIQNKWDINIPYNSALTNPSVAANMKYLLTTIDVANEILNGNKTTDYGNCEYATLAAADTIATNTAIDELIKQSIAYHFTATTTNNTTEFSFDISAAGEFHIDWGDGQKQIITKTLPSLATYSHRYSKAGKYNIRFGGVATEYYTDAAISFNSNLNLSAIDGSLGAIFPTLANGRNPSFMFTFADCQNLTSQIPDNLFAGIVGNINYNMFYSTFSNSGISGEIPKNLFSGLSGTPASSAFFGTFYECKGLTGQIPENLFGGISGGVGSEAFSITFAGCTGLTGIPENLFGDIAIGYDGYQLNGMFQGCTNLTGPSVRINGQYLYELWPDMPINVVENMYSGATGLSDYDNIPQSWGGGRRRDIVPAPDDAEYKFIATTTPETTYFEFEISSSGEYYIDWGDGTTETFVKNALGTEEISHEYAVAGTYNIRIGGQAREYQQDYPTIYFSGNTNLASVSGSFGEIFPTLPDGTRPAFSSTFRDCTNLTSISENLFDGITLEANSYDTFNYTFAGCTGLTEIPENLFASINSLEYTSSIFSSTFAGCTSLTSIPKNLFASITSVEGSFGAFAGTFAECTGLTSIPENLFANLTSVEDSYMTFWETFAGCYNLSGPSARLNGQYLYNIWPDVGMWMYMGCEGLSDYNCIPSEWGGGGKNCLSTDPT